MKLLIYIILIVLPIFSIAQSDWKTVEWEEFEKAMEVVSEQYSETIYSVDIRYSTFKGLKSTKPYETSVGYFQKNNEVKQNSILRVTTIEDAKHKVTLDSINKIIAINNVDNTTNIVDIEQYKRSKDLVETLKRKESDNSITYLIKYKSNSPISHTKLVLKKTGELKNIVMYYAQEKEYRDENDELKKDYLWVKMDYFNYSKNLKNKEVKKSQLLIKSNNNFKLASSYKGFQLADLRYKK